MEPQMDALQAMTFEEAIAALEDILSQMEKGTLPLDQAISGFESGIALIRHCNDILENYEKKISVLTEGKNGAVQEAPFDRA